MNVDLPAPFGPSNPVMPGGTVTVTSLSPDTWPYHFDRCSRGNDSHATTSTARTRRSRITTKIPIITRMTMIATYTGTAGTPLLRKIALAMTSSISPGEMTAQCGWR